jgi:pilus assembly protein Flp/PilA
VDYRYAGTRLTLVAWKNTVKGMVPMSRMGRVVLTACMKVRDLMHGEDGQDLVEYALLVALIALALVGGVKHVATAVNSVFTNVSSSLA